ncbi:MAG: hypothetical protein DRP78_07305 [Candidatus Omnitrophota bacterium]|nr:MAG: hypothetical protein DRP78_07305 [Candidatus Omnitrophota bacterium]
MNKINLQKSEKCLSIILPAYNEASSIKQVVLEIADFLFKEKLFIEYELIIVDDGSRDKTNHIIDELKTKISYLKLITHPQNLGYGQALISGLKQAKFEYIFFMDADGQFKINELNLLCAYIPEFAIVLGYRIRREDSFYRRILGKFYTSLVFFGLKGK